jgi:hypothetical protein
MYDTPEDERSAVADKPYGTVLPVTYTAYCIGFTSF